MSFAVSSTGSDELACFPRAISMAPRASVILSAWSSTRLLISR
jgi:hypothetical protein